MNKVLFPILVLAIILGMSDCGEREKDITNPYFPDGNMPVYLTVTYQKEDNEDYPPINKERGKELPPTTGEPPVDTKRYKTPIWNNKNFEYEFIDEADVLDQGTLEKEGYIFWCWKNISYTDHWQYKANPNPEKFFDETNKIKMYNNVVLVPIWAKIQLQE